MKTINLLKTLIFISFLALSGCKGSSKSDDKTNIFDPASPGGGGGSSRIPKVTSLNVVTQPNNSRLITYNIPSTYYGQNYEIYIYRTVGSTLEFQLDDPSGVYSTAYLYYVKDDFTPITSGSFTDDTTLIGGVTYNYWVYVKMDSKWSSAATYEYTYPTTISTILIPSPADLWKQYSQSYGQKQISSTIGYVTLGPGTSTYNNPVGGIAFAEDGSVAYVPETNNNRVMIYVSDSYYACKDYDKTSFDYEVCKILYFNYPIMPVAVLGQASFDTNYPCGHASNPLTSDQCLTSPRYASIANGKLVISDSGNNRIFIYPKIPIYGCYHLLNLMGEITENECAPYKVIGKQTLTDMTTYSVATDGISSLSNPTGTFYSSDGDLYIADTGNHRVVSAKDIFNDEAFNCTSGTWKTSKCSFITVLGQNNLNSKLTFNDVYNSTVTYNLASHTLSDSGNFLKTHFANPTEVKVKNGKLYIVSNENFRDNSSSPSLNLHGRINVFETNPLSGSIPTCNNSNWGSPVSCGSSYLIGQESHTKLIELDSSTNYEDIPFAFKSIDIDFVGDYLVAIDKDLKNIYTWSSTENTNDGIPYVKTVNPAGAYDSEKSRYLPNLGQLVSIEAVTSTGNVYVFDGTEGKIYEIPFKN